MNLIAMRRKVEEHETIVNKFSTFILNLLQAARSQNIDGNALKPLFASESIVANIINKFSFSTVTDLGLAGVAATYLFDDRAVPINPTVFSVFWPNNEEYDIKTCRVRLFQTDPNFSAWRQDLLILTKYEETIINVVDQKIQKQLQEAEQAQETAELEQKAQRLGLKL